MCLAPTWNGILRADTEVREFDIAEGQAVETLKEAAFQGDVEILISVSRNSDVRTNSVKGAFGVQEALDRMLEGTPFVAVPVSGGKAFGVIKRAQKGGNVPKRSKNKQLKNFETKTQMNLEQSNSKPLENIYLGINIDKNDEKKYLPFKDKSLIITKNVNSNQIAKLLSAVKLKAGKLSS